MQKGINFFSNKEFLTIVSLPRNDISLAKAAFKCGADGIKVHANVEHKASGTKFGPWEKEKSSIKEILEAVKCPVGLMPGAKKTLSYHEMVDAILLGIHFIDIYDHDMPSWMLSLAISKVIAIGSNYSIEEANSLVALGADFIEASIVPSAEYSQPLTVKDLAAYKGLARAVQKPIVVPSQKKIEPSDVKILKKLGIRGVILGTISLGDTVKSFEERLPLFLNE